MTQEIRKSVLSLIKNNNGFFKSEKQSEFLISQFVRFDNLIGYNDSGFHSVPLFVEYDEKGVLKMYSHSNITGVKVLFERQVAGSLTDLQIKEIKSFDRKVKAIEKEFSEKEQSFKDGSYNSTGDVSTYTESMIERYNYYQSQKRNQINSIKRRIEEIKNSANVLASLEK